jgi:hypothetical protein
MSQSLLSWLEIIGSAGAILVLSWFVSPKDRNKRKLADRDDWGEVEMSDTGLLIAGIVVLLITAFFFWRCMPRDGKLYRFADTEWEPYIGVTFCSGVALGLTMILSSLINIFGT